MYYLIVLESGNLKIRVSAGPHSLKPVGNNLSSPLVVSGVCQKSLAFLGLEVHASNLFLYHHMTILSLCFSLSTSYEDTSHIALRAHSTPVWEHLNYLHQQWLSFRTSSYSEILRLQHTFFFEGGRGEREEGTIQPIAVEKVYIYFIFFTSIF